MELRKYLAFGLSLLAATGFAANVIDQNQPSGPNYMASFSQGDLAQSFQQANNNISGAGILLQSGVGGSALVTIALWDALPNAIGANMITSGSATGTQGSWVDVYWSPVSITPGDTMYLVFSGGATLGIAGDVSDPYPNGKTYANPGFNEFPSFDYTFRTYAADQPQQPGAVPDAGSTCALMTLALGGLQLLRRQS